VIPYEKLILLGIMTWQEYRVIKQQQHITWQAEKIKSYQEQVSYLCSILNKHKIRLDEFDYIALPNVTSVKREINTD